ncbi:LysR family transcriptional regulator [Sphaerisporangium fuscum]|uniref:LysR family transcriptional regulator n=1 Tax=Sphaerisporangium fuscum TaxID=2835868 RepID=UPI001BDC1531|nr:LysR family transcriptional regulator [Sphaerisporangium fuscum]
MTLELADLHAFATAAATGSLSGAARELHVTQPSVSERLGRLERLIGRPLLVRSNRGVTLTPAGRRLLPHAERCLALAGRALAAARAEDTTAALHVTTYASYAPLAVPFVAAALRPLKCSITVDDQHSRDALHRVAAGSTDIAFTLPVPHAHEVRLHRFRRDEVIVVAHPGHPLAGRRVDLGELGAHHLAFNNWGTGAAAFRERLSDQPAGAHQVYDVSPAETVAELARAGLAVGLLTRSTVRQDLAHGTLVQVDVTDLPEWHVEVMLAHHRDRAGEPAIAAVVAALDPVPALPGMTK